MLKLSQDPLGLQCYSSWGYSVTVQCFPSSLRSPGLQCDSSVFPYICKPRLAFLFWSIVLLPFKLPPASTEARAHACPHAHAHTHTETDKHTHIHSLTSGFSGCPFSKSAKVSRLLANVGFSGYRCQDQNSQTWGLACEGIRIEGLPSTQL